MVPIVGLMLLVGMVAIASVVILLGGLGELAGTENDAEDERIEASFTKLAHDATTVGVSSADGRSTTLDLEGESIVLDESAGHLTVEISDAEDPVLERELTALRYDDGDRQLAYQGGGVWRTDGDGARMLTAPTVAYREESLTFPFVDVRSAETVDSDRVTFTEGETAVPLGGLMSGETVTITLEGDLYEGWATYFERTIGESAVSIDHDDESVQVVLGYPEMDGDFESGVVAQGDFQSTNPNACVDGSVVVSGDVLEDDCRTHDHGPGGENVSVSPIDAGVEFVVDGIAETEPHIDGKSTDRITTGTYFVEGNLTRTDDLTVDVSDGNVTLAVDGHVRLDNASLSIEGTEESNGSVRLYTTGDVAIAGGDGGVVMDGEPDASRFQLYGTSQLHFGLGQGEYVGTVYAPRTEPATGTNEAADGHVESANNCEPIDGEEPDVCIGTGSSTFVGSIVAGSISLEQNLALEYDDGLQGLEPTLYEPALPPALASIDLRLHGVEVDGN